MIFADKLISLRKKNGMSQEELADKLGVSRQAVSKWESCQSIPDLDKILALSKIFGVSTDVLLKDELEIEDLKSVDSGDESLKKVTLEMANDFLDKRKSNSKKVALGVFLCIISPITLIVLSGLCEFLSNGLTENIASTIGLITLFVLVALAVSLFITSSTKLKDYEFLGNESFDTEYGVTGMAKEKKKEFQDEYNRKNLIGIMLCILSVIPIFACLFTEQGLYIIIGVGLMLLIVAIGCFLIVDVNYKMGSIKRLLQEGDYTKARKLNSKSMDIFSSCYWMVITAIYLIWSFISNDWHITWIVWAVAGILFGVVSAIFEIVMKSKN